MLDFLVEAARDDGLGISTVEIRRATGGSFLNFLADTNGTAAAYMPRDYERLRAIRACYDPDDVVRLNDRIGVGQDARVRFMVIETFTRGPRPVYERAADRGRMLPPGLEYVDSWVDERRLDRCFQLMETDDPSLFDEWIASWDDLAEFEVVPVISSAAAATRAAG